MNNKMNITNMFEFFCSRCTVVECCHTISNDSQGIALHQHATNTYSTQWHAIPIIMSKMLIAYNIFHSDPKQKIMLVVNNIYIILHVFQIQEKQSKTYMVVYGHSRSPALSPFDKPQTASCSSVIETLTLLTALCLGVPGSAGTKKVTRGPAVERIRGVFTHNALYKSTFYYYYYSW